MDSALVVFMTNPRNIYIAEQMPLFITHSKEYADECVRKLRELCVYNKSFERKVLEWHAAYEENNSPCPKRPGITYKERAKHPTTSYQKLHEYATAAKAWIDKYKADEEVFRINNYNTPDGIQKLVQYLPDYKYLHDAQFNYCPLPILEP